MDDKYTGPLLSSDVPVFTSEQRVSVTVLRARQPDRIAGRVSNRIKKSNVPVSRLNSIIVFPSQPAKQLHYSSQCIEIVSYNSGAAAASATLEEMQRCCWLCSSARRLEFRQLNGIEHSTCYLTRNSFLIRFQDTLLYYFSKVS